MPQTHILKCHPEPFRAMVSGEKSYEVRKDDRGYGLGDTLILREWCPQTERYSGATITADVSYITRGPDWGLPDGLCVLGVIEETFEEGEGFDLHREPPKWADWKFEHAAKHTDEAPDPDCFWCERAVH